MRTLFLLITVLLFTYQGAAIEKVSIQIICGGMDLGVKKFTEEHQFLEVHLQKEWPKIKSLKNCRVQSNFPSSYFYVENGRLGDVSFQRRQWFIPDGEKSKIMFFSRFEVTEEALDKLKLRFFLAKNLKTPDSAEIKKNVISIIRWIQSKVGNPARLEKDIIALSSWVNRDFESYIRIGQQPSKSSSRVDNLYAVHHEVAHLWWTEKIQEAYLYEGLAEFTGGRAAAEIFGADWQVLLDSSKLGVFAETTVRGHNHVFSDPFYRYDIKHGVYTEAYATQYYAGILIFEKLRGWIGDKGIWSVLRELNSKGQGDINSKRLKQILEKKFPRIKKKLSLVLSSPPSALLSKQDINRILNTKPKAQLSPKSVAEHAYNIIYYTRHNLNDATLGIVKSFFSRKDIDHRWFKNTAFLSSFSGNKKLVPLFIELLASEKKSFKRRWSIAMALGRLQPKNLVKILKENFNDEFTILSALGEANGHQGAVNYLLKTANSEKISLKLRLMALVNLRRVTPKKVIEVKSIKKLLDKTQNSGEIASIMQFMIENPSKSYCANNFMRDFADKPAIGLKVNRLLQFISKKCSSRI